MKMNAPKLSSVVTGLQEPVKLLLSIRPEDRPDEHEFLKVKCLFMIEGTFSKKICFYRLNFSMTLE